MRTVNEKNADFAVTVKQAASEKSSKLKLMDVFYAELGRLKRIAAGFGLSASDGEDVLQDVSIKALERSGENRTHQEYIRWLTKVTINRCLTEHRRRRSYHRQTHEILKRRAELKTKPNRTDEKVINAEELEIVRENLQKIDDALLAPVILRYFCDLNSSQIGEILGLKASTVRSRLREGRMILAKRLLERGVGT
ncbi:MAG: RNA polymerase sigma factor [Planctomycetes bacterium]|nr:RNA polymerase sigma factor [Planctomycetota bacterium]